VHKQRVTLTLNRIEARVGVCAHLRVNPRVTHTLG